MRGEPELINPDYYISGKDLETIDVIDAFTNDLSGREAYDTGNIIKYACRWKKKGGKSDLLKIIWYANDILEHLPKDEETLKNIK